MESIIKVLNERPIMQWLMMSSLILMQKTDMASGFHSTR